jgi:hypothetical protein
MGLKGRKGIKRDKCFVQVEGIKGIKEKKRA